MGGCFWIYVWRWVVASKFMYDNFRVNIGCEHGDRILEYDIEKILNMFFRILYLNLLRVYAASKIGIF